MCRWPVTFAGPPCCFYEMQTPAALLHASLYSTPLSVHSEVCVGVLGYSGSRQPTPQAKPPPPAPAISSDPWPVLLGSSRRSQPFRVPPTITLALFPQSCKLLPSLPMGGVLQSGTFTGGEAGPKKGPKVLWCYLEELGCEGTT